MSFFEFYRKRFRDGFGGYSRPPEEGGDDDSNGPNRPNDPFWNPEINPNSREFTPFFHFNVVTDPFEMHKLFDQVNEMMSSFLSPPEGFFGPHGFGGFEPPNDSAIEDKKSLRDQYLKPGYKKSLPNNEGFESDLIGPWKGPSSNHDHGQDGSSFQPKIHSSFRSVIRKSVTLPDGSVKTEEIIRDSDGLEQKTEYHTSPDEHSTGFDSSLFELPSISDFFKEPIRPGIRAITPKDQYLKPGYEHPKRVDDKVDTDLDIQIQEKGIESLPSLPAEPEFVEPSNQQFSFKSVIKRSRTLPNGEVETEEIVRNSDGSETRSVVRTLPDGSITTFKDSPAGNLSIGDFGGTKDWGSHSYLMKGLSDFVNVFFK